MTKDKTQNAGVATDSLHELVSQYKRLGWKEEHHFTGEYVLLIDSRMDKVRIYENGDVWRSDPNSGEYIKTQANAWSHRQEEG